MGKALVIVESPAKAKTIGGMLGPDFIVESSIGHIRDLPRGADEVPAAYKGEAWSRLGVDVDNGFKPLYVVSTSKKSVVANLKRLLKTADELYLATDEDREGESIAWHLFEVLSPTVPVKRMVFHEITPAAIARAVEESRDLDRHLVDAQEARRILDRLYGYEVSPVLWRKVMPKLSAGRVQSVATRMVVERERARMRFNSATWWGIDGTFSHSTAPAGFGAALITLGGTTVAGGKDFNENGEQVSKNAVRVLVEADATSVAEALVGQSFTVSAVTERPFRRSPAAPFMTSTLQQEAGRKLRFSAQRAMQVAQRLYEQGFITYMRTDSTTLSDEALTAARTQARQMYGDAYVPDAPRRYERKVKNAQEAHEAIRPSGETFRTPEQAAGELSGDELRLYELIWKRTVASQMNDATGTSAQVRLLATVPTGLAQGEEAEFSASGRIIAFPGFLRAYVEGEDDPDAELADREVVLPPLTVGDVVQGSAFEPGSHATQPPARYTEASLVKAMEELGVGRPSTYASVIATILDRGYVWKKGTALVPSFTAFAVVGLLERYFGNLVDYGFTASMEDDLDSIAAGREESLPWLSRFYFGTSSPGVTDAGVADPNGDGNTRMNGGALGLKAAVAAHLGDIDAREINSIPLGAGADGVPIVARVGRYGPYLQRGEERASLPDDICPDELTVARAEELLAAPSNDRVLGADPETGLDVQVKAGRFGPYVQLGEAVEGGGKPRTSSLFSTMDVATLTFEQALELLRIPRTVGADPESGEDVVAHNGKFGPYLKRGTDTRSLTSEDQLLTITLPEAQALFAQPKQQRGRASAAPLREMGVDPATELPVLLKDGRFGPYVTDGTTNASLRKGDVVETLTMERASELLADRRAAGPSTRKKAAKKSTAAKKTAKKTTTAKKSAKKATAAKKTAKKATGVKKAAALAAAPLEPF
ncbi:MAG TPA: type I DNA topoisomerase [Acidimicrobiales bacterium]|jgi:DNA topoisomerase-1|nr:type I DNA topoisomerase [Acidimicrobiales bacterium]